jgi:hypothetical protein
MNCDDEQKKYYRFYRQFLATMFPESVFIDNATWGAPVYSPEVTFKSFLKNVYLEMPSFIKEVNRKRKLKNPPGGTNLQKCLERQLSTSREIEHYLSIPPMEELLKKIDIPQFTTLFTITSLIENLGGKSSLEDYMHEEMM